MNGLRICGILLCTMYNGIKSHKKEQNNAICRNMDGTGDSHTEWSKSERERLIPYGITYIWNLIYGTNELFHRKENHGLVEQTCSCQEGGSGSGVDREFGVNRCKLLPLEWISNEILLWALGTMSSQLWWTMIMWENGMCTCMCNWVTTLYSRKKIVLGK